ncbi:DNA-directed RNA polymerase subunit D [Halopenitus persicus]|uniref:DNA-directed RNA polymerase subunit Rpo3 n=1 Tax=Halopenitus persicus TaxID=1048396 RepID=A0A1H3DRB0_9EURY|nr:DNA-directed RNA polymerase subunit D [Halopenitus persicus]QHS16341.1 DNA-directed RNA polymerase subunit D [haloarchaeon 3A1-DGR]SDX68901.1 DNA-directed RNA polymerase, subunit D [Halopenitus persicus]
MSEADFDVQYIERDDRSARVLIRGLSPAFANGIRRAMIADVPTFSIDTVRFVENSSVMFDEMLGLRLGLVPLTTPIDDFEIGDEVTLALDVAGPGTAYSGDLVSSEPLVEPADKNVPLIELKEGQRVELEADAVLDTGKEHAKHQGGVSVGYRHLQRVTVEGDLGEFDEEETRILRGVIETEDGEIVPTEAFDHDLSERYPGKEVSVEDVPGAFVFHVETDGSVDVEELIVRAIGTIEERADELRTTIAV